MMAEKEKAKKCDGVGLNVQYNIQIVNATVPIVQKVLF